MDPLVENAIKSKFGIGKLSDNQKDAITSLLAKRDVFLSLPTGAGKSLIFHALPTARKAANPELPYGNVLVIQPIIALMEDQMRYLQSKSIQSIRLSRSDTKTSMHSLSDILGSEVIIASPEALIQNYREVLKEPRFSENLLALAIDESHMVVKW